MAGRGGRDPLDVMPYQQVMRPPPAAQAGMSVCTSLRWLASEWGRGIMPVTPQLDHALAPRRGRQSAFFLVQGVCISSVTSVPLQRGVWTAPVSLVRSACQLHVDTHAKIPETLNVGERVHSQIRRPIV